MISYILFRSAELQFVGGFVALIFLYAFIVILVALFLYYVFWALRKRPVTGVESLKGSVGVVVRDFVNDAGEVSVDGVIWKARAYDAGALRKGDEVVVVEVSSLTLLVRKRE